MDARITFQFAAADKFRYETIQAEAKLFAEAPEGQLLERVAEATLAELEKFLVLIALEVHPRLTDEKCSELVGKALLKACGR